MKLKTVFFLGAIGILSLSLLPGPVSAGDSKKWRANNHSEITVKVIWTASGCAGVTNECDKSGNVEYVCKSKKLKPGEKASYKFDDGTSERKKRVCALEGKKKSLMGNTGNRTKNGIRLDDNDVLEWYND